MKKIRLTRNQKKALEAYKFAVSQEDRYLGSVFVTTNGMKQYEHKTKIAYDACKVLGMDHSHGL